MYKGILFYFEVEILWIHLTRDKRIYSLKLIFTLLLEGLKTITISKILNSLPLIS